MLIQIKKVSLLSILLFLATTITSAQNWGDIDYKGAPWTRNISEPIEISRGLQNRHISVWASHGRYYDQTKGQWQWQRPPLFCTREDLFTQTIVIPYLIPMLENAGAVVFTPRERDWQKNEVIVDNDNDSLHYAEHSDGEGWQFTDTCGFAYHAGIYHDRENPFRAGTARMTDAVRRKKEITGSGLWNLDSGLSAAYYMPEIPEDGRYAVYVSYQTRENSISDAHYTICHSGEETHFQVNQQMGGGTWVYLGTFDFKKGCSQENCVVLTNESKDKGVVTTDAVRFGGGMGNISRGGTASRLPRCLEGARYYAQWAGMDRSIYSSKDGTDDYKDDINVRSLMTNYLAGGSVYVPNREGAKVPIELALAVHSDAGYNKNGTDIYGTMSICTTTKDDKDTLDAGLTRQVNAEFARQMLQDINHDITETFGRWNFRSMRDKNYSESRLPEVPSAIIETLSHQSFPDMKMGQDPNFKFVIARALYKTILRFICEKHEKKYVVEPLTPENFRIDIDKKGEVSLSWTAADDPLEPTAEAKSYLLYTQIEGQGWDNGQKIKSTSCRMKIDAEVQYNFRVVAVNDGGKSFPTETLSAYYYPGSKKKVLVMNGFHRLSSPAVIDYEQSQGFDILDDVGVWEGVNPGWCGRQVSFDKSKMGSGASSGLGYSTDGYAGKFLAGSTADYAVAHTRAMARCRKISVCSASSKAIESGLVKLKNYAMIDLILGNEKDDGHSLKLYKTFPRQLQKQLDGYTSKGGSLMVSGSYVASDMRGDSEAEFLARTLKVSLSGINKDSSIDGVSGMGTNFSIYRSLNEQHYAAQHVDILKPLDDAFATMLYGDSSCASVAYQGKKYNSITMGFPFECIKDEEIQASLMTGILNFLIR